MEYAKAHSKLLYIYSFIILIITILLIELASTYVIKAYTIHWLALAVALIICFSPLGNRRLVATENEKPRHTAGQWIKSLFMLQVALFFVFIGVTLIFSYWLPLTSPMHSQALTKTLNTLLKQDGVLPWGIYAIYASGLGYISYIKNEDAYTSELLTPLIKTKPGELLANVLNIQARSATFIVLTITCAFITLLLAVTITPKSAPLHTGFHAKTLIIITALVILGFSSPFKRVVRKLLNPKIPVWLSTSSTLILFSLFIWLLNALFGHLGQTPIPVPAFIQWIESKNPLNLWLIFSAAWWLSWTPMLATHIARLSRGYRIRSLIITTLILPTLFTLALIKYPNHLDIVYHYPRTSSLIAIIAFIYLITILMEKTTLPLLIRTYLSKRDAYKRRDPIFYFRKLFQIMLVIIYIYLPTGISVTTLILFAMSFSFTLQTPFVAILSLFKLKKS